MNESQSMVKDQRKQPTNMRIIIHKNNLSDKKCLISDTLVIQTLESKEKVASESDKKLGPEFMKRGLFSPLIQETDFYKICGFPIKSAEHFAEQI